MNTCDSCNLIGGYCGNCDGHHWMSDLKSKTETKESPMTKTILNLTQHEASAEQVDAGVITLSDLDSDFVKRQLTFSEIPSSDGIRNRAERIAHTANIYGVKFAMIGGAPYLMSALETALKHYGITPLYAFSVRESVEETLEDGTIRKTAIFKHKGFIEA